MSAVPANLFPGAKRARAILNELVQSRQLSTEAVNYLAALLDPFHDEPLPSPCWPDGQSARSVPRTEQTLITVNRGTVPDGLWDCFIIFVPYMKGSTMAAYDYNTYGLAPVLRAANVETLAPGWNVLKHASGSWTLASPGIVSEDQNLSPAGNQPLWPAARRLVGSGLEVVNTTSELYKQGSVTYWRAATERTNVQLVSGASDYREYIWTSGMPFSLAEIGVMPDTITEHAKEGAMLIAAPDGVEQPIRNCTGKTLIYGSSNASRLGGPIYCAIPTTGTNQSTFDFRDAHFNFSGCFFSGLSSQTTLTMTARYQWEDFPQPYEGSLVSLARPAPPYDPIMMEILTRVIRDMPVGCRQRDNPLGEWFNQIMDTIAAIAPTLTGLPYVGAFAGPIGMAAKAAATVNRNATATSPTPVSNKPPKVPPPVPKRPSHLAVATTSNKLATNRRVK